MTSIEMLPDGAVVRVSLAELRILNNALNEVCNALAGADFSTRMGTEPEEAARLLDQVHTLITRLERR